MAVALAGLSVGLVLMLLGILLPDAQEALVIGGGLAACASLTALAVTSIRRKDRP